MPAFARINYRDFNKVRRPGSTLTIEDQPRGPSGDSKFATLPSAVFEILPYFIFLIRASAISAGVRAIATPAASNAAILPSAVPLPPETIAPA